MQKTEIKLVMGQVMMTTIVLEENVTLTRGPEIILGEEGARKTPDSRLQGNSENYSKARLDPNHPTHKSYIIRNETEKAVEY